MLKARPDTPELGEILEQKKAMEKAESLMRNNKDLERRLEILSLDVEELKKDKKEAQESHS